MKLVGVVFVAALTLASAICAEDLGLIPIHSQEQAEFAQQILGDAFAKIDNRFLVLASVEQQEELTKAGMPFELVMRDANIRTLYLVHPRKREVEPTAIAALGATTRLNETFSVIESSSSAASSIRDEGQFFVIPLEEKQVSLHYVSPQGALPMAPLVDYPTDTLINRIRKDSIIAYNTRLEAYRTRYVWTDSIDRARDWLVQKFQQFGYTNVTTPSFFWNGGYHYNVKAVKAGYAEPDQVIVIGGHYDSWNSQSDPMIFAPGSDDNASGTTLTMEVARILANVPLRKTVIFMPFSAEEVGLVGSAAAAADFRATHTKVEVMFNYDMVGYVEDSYWDIEISSGTNTAYRTVSANAADRLTSLIPSIVPPGGSSDHASFLSEGFNAVDAIEADFNFPGWHTNIDLTSRMNFDYMTEVVKMAAASVAIVANAGAPTNVTSIVDQGDGQSLEVTWGPCYAGYQYTLYYGTTPGVYTDSVALPLGQCSAVVNGLEEGLTYYFAAFGKPSDGYRAISGGEGSEMPLTNPRAPLSPLAEPGPSQIILKWRANREADLSHYNIYRKLSLESEYYLWHGNVADTQFIDTQVTSNVLYNYRVTAVDQTGHESDLSAEVASYPATFDGGIMIADEFTRDYDQFPDQAEQEAFWDTAFGATQFIVERVDAPTGKLLKSSVGRFSSVFWLDDDWLGKNINASDSTIRWYLTNPTNLFVAGYKTVQNWSALPVPSNHVLYNEFRVSSYNWSSVDRFIGATGQNGWPNIQFDATRGMATIKEVPVLTLRSGATIIYAYDSYSDNPSFEGRPCGVAYNSANGKRVLLTFPLYYLTPASSQALVAKVKQYFGEDVVIETPGDADGSGAVDLTDLSNLIAYMVGAQPSLPSLNGGDLDGSCNINLIDLTWMIAYLIYGIPAPLPGCVIP